MNSIPAAEVKRRGVAALEEAAKSGPVHIIRNNRPAGVYMSEQEYARLLAASRAAATPIAGASVWELIRDRPYEGTRTKEQIDAQLHEERADWGKR
jgi:PHD/YefM family antitoxin component YafN of YafNO toxin-antitoxin module